MIVVGADTSTKRLALAGYENQHVLYTYRAYELGKRFDPESCFLILGLVKEFLSESTKYLADPKHGWDGVAYIEEPVFSRNQRSSIVQAYIIGATIAAFRQANLEVMLVNNTEWKKQVLGKGNANKEEIKSYIQGHVPPRYSDDQDVCDAACILEYGMRNVRLSQVIQDV